LLFAACQPTPVAVNQAPAGPVFPTMTPGRQISGVLPTVVALSLDGNLANPATAVALANRPTATPDYTACPPSASPVLADTPTNSPEMAAEIARYMSFGGSPESLETALRDQWGVLNEVGSVRADIDFTGEGTPEIVAAYSV